MDYASGKHFYLTSIQTPCILRDLTLVKRGGGREGPDNEAVKPTSVGSPGGWKGLRKFEKHGRARGRSIFPRHESRKGKQSRFVALVEGDPKLYAN